MVKKRTEIKKIISEYQARLQALGIEVSRIILYGFYAQRRAREYSDIDIAVISPTILPRIPLPPVPSPPDLPLSETRDLVNDAGMKGNIRAY